MSLNTLLLVILIVLILGGGFGFWRGSWWGPGYLGPAGGIILFVLIVILLVYLLAPLLGRGTLL